MSTSKVAVEVALSWSMGASVSEEVELYEYEDEDVSDDVKVLDLDATMGSDSGRMEKAMEMATARTMLLRSVHGMGRSSGRSNPSFRRD